MISIKNLTKKFGEKTAVDNLNLDIARGELFSFLGPNGAGKTTTIKLMTGLLKPTSGEILIGGYDIQRDAISAKGLIGYIPDFPFLYEKLTAREFIEFIGGLYNMDSGDIGKNAEELFEIFEMTSYVDNLIEDYSHGMKQRLVMCASLIHAPELIIVDEPMVGLDPKSSRIVKKMLKEKAMSGVTVFLSTHTLSVAEELSDRVGIIHKGRLIALGSVETLRDMAHNPSGNFEDIFLELTEGKA
jgi:ABC-2 type transport system ATP-binding protein